MRGKGLKLCHRRFKEQFLLSKSSEAVAQAAQGSGGVTIPGGVQECRNVALRDVVSGHGGDGLVVGQMITVVFSNLNDSMIL